MFLPEILHVPAQKLLLFFSRTLTCEITFFEVLRIISVLYLSEYINGEGLGRLYGSLIRQSTCPRISQYRGGPLRNTD
jgi:hypothetical protein